MRKVHSRQGEVGGIASVKLSQHLSDKQMQPLLTGQAHLENLPEEEESKGEPAVAVEEGVVEVLQSDGHDVIVPKTPP